MKFEDRVEAFKKLLFTGYVRGDKTFEEDWKEEATELALIVKFKKTEEVVCLAITEFLKEKFEKDDGYTDFEELSKQMTKRIRPFLE